MKRRLFLASAATAVVAGTPASALLVPLASPDALTTRAESSAFAATSSNADIARFFAVLDQRGAPIVRGSLGRSHEGRSIPYVIASRPPVSTPGEARALGRPIVYVQAGVRGGDVAGKEAMLAIVRDLCVSTEKTLLEDIVLIVAPVINVDGNEHQGIASLYAPEIDGPARVGIRENASGIDLDRDYVRFEAPETRAIMAFVKLWKPDLFIDLHEGSGSFHDFGVTHAGSLHPAAYYGGAYARDTMLPKIRAELHEKFGIETFPMGHFGRSKALPSPPAPGNPDFGWFAPDHSPRVGVNYIGLRGTVALRVDAYPHDPFERRIYTTRAFVESALGYASEHDDEIEGVANTASRWLGGMLPIRATFPPKVAMQTVEWEILALASTEKEPGVPQGFKRTGTFSSAKMPIYDRYVGSTYISQPKGYLIPYEYAALVQPLLEQHGIIFEQLIGTRKIGVASYALASMRPIAGRFGSSAEYVAKFGAIQVPAVQTLGPLASVLLEPESDGGFFASGLFDGILKVGAIAPVLRIV